MNLQPFSVTRSHNLLHLPLDVLGKIVQEVANPKETATICRRMYEATQVVMKSFVVSITPKSAGRYPDLQANLSFFEKVKKVYLSQKQECIDLSCLETLKVHMPKKWICRPLSVERFFFVEKVLKRANLFRLTAELAEQADIPFHW